MMKTRGRSKNPTKLRYSPEASYARGSETRQRLIAAAIRLFGRHGYDGASTRDIATAAALNTPALQYYFNNKEGLYAACAETIVAGGWAAMQDVVLRAEGAVAQGAGESELIEAFCAIQDRLVDFLDDAGGDWLVWLAREQTGMGSSSGHLLRHPKVMRIRRAGRNLVARLLDRPPRDAESALHAWVLNSHLLQVYLMRDNALQAFGWRRIDQSKLALIKRVTRAQTVAALRAAVAAGRRRTTRS